MQSVIRSARNPMLWGIASIVMATVVGVVVAWVYVAPPSQELVTFNTDDAAAVSTGDTVRVAGIVVGKVKDRAIDQNHVRVRLSVDKHVFIGDQTQVEVRMLTVIGGYYVSLIPLGDAPLGSRPIPVERVTMPYSLIRTLSDSTKITDNVATKPINESLNQIQQGLTGSNTETLTELLDAGNTVSQVLERQGGQLTSILEMSNEYIQRLNDNRELLEHLISRVAILEETLVLYGKGFGSAIDGLGKIMTRLEPLGDFYMHHRQDFLNKVRGILGEFQTIADRNGVIVRILGRVRQRMETTLEAQNAGTPPELFATDLCFPTEGSRC
ncbi:MlaD family protein [Mycobacterium sp.]|uniref:MlaD family protein n=1 Tax=Mycobacterium sp. TaxID=1785 RepID=UPI002C86CCAD|nr:MlaD family protein [Mycobacterium sp.]HKP39880.1 MlaD family protein [Mycobacterium sp.]